MTYNLKLITTIIVSSVAVSLVIGRLLLVAPAGAQTAAQVLLTWQADNFYPADFGGKAAATTGTPITVSAEVIQNGKLADLSKATFIWYVDEKLQSRGENLKETTFNVSKLVGDSYFVRVNIQSSEGGVFENSIRIPVSKPLVVLESPYPNQLVKSGEKAEVTAVPYFFNISNFQGLDFFWRIDNGPTQESGNDNQLILNTGNAAAGQIIQITGTARNANNVIETATSRTRLIIY